MLPAARSAADRGDGQVPCGRMAGSRGSEMGWWRRYPPAPVRGRGRAMVVGPVVDVPGRGDGPRG